MQHLVRWHPDTDIVLNKKEECSQCDRKFFWKKTLIKHLKVEHGTEYKRFKCPEEDCTAHFRLQMVRFNQGFHNHVFRGN